MMLVTAGLSNTEKKCVNDYAEPVQIDILFHERNLENCARMKESVWNVL